MEDELMCGSRYLVLAAAVAAAITLPGCKRDFKAPVPKAGARADMALIAGFATRLHAPLALPPQKDSVVTFASLITLAHF